MRIPLVVSALFLLAPSLASAASCSFRMDVLDVGQGDAIFVQTPDCKTALIDGGDTGSGTVIRAHLKSLGVTSLDMVVVSHMHQDHLAGIVEIGQGSVIPVSVVYDRGGTYASKTYTDFAALYSAKRQTPVLGQVISLGTSVTFTVVAVNTATGDENERSIALKLNYGDFDAFLGGDLDSTVEAAAAPLIGPVEVYKVDHHGSSGSSCNSLMALTQPEVALISVGYNNTYGHPAQAAEDRILPWADLYQTEDPATATATGTITVTSDGSNYEITQAGSTWAYVADADSSGQVQTPGSVSQARGSTTSTLSAATADDGNRWTLTSTKSGGTYQNDWTFSYTVPATPSILTVAWNGKNSVTSAITVSLYNNKTGKWDSLGATSLGSTEDTTTWSTNAPANYVTAAGVVKVNFSGPKSAKTYTSYTDAAWLVWEP